LPVLPTMLFTLSSATTGGTPAVASTVRVSSAHIMLFGKGLQTSTSTVQVVPTDAGASYVTTPEAFTLLFKQVPPVLVKPDPAATLGSLVVMFLVLPVLPTRLLTLSFCTPGATTVVAGPPDFPFGPAVVTLSTCPAG